MILGFKARVEQRQGVKTQQTYLERLYSPKYVHHTLYLERLYSPKCVHHTLYLEHKGRVFQNGAKKDGCEMSFSPRTVAVPVVGWVLGENTSRIQIL